MAVAAGSPKPAPMEPLRCAPKTSPFARSPDRPSLHRRERSSPVKNRKRENCTSGTVRDEDGNILIYSANRRRSSLLWSRMAGLLGPTNHRITFRPFRKFHLGWIREAGGICRTVWPTALSSRDQWCDEPQASMPLGGCDLVAHPFADYFAFAQLGCELIKTRSYDDRSGA